MTRRLFGPATAPAGTTVELDREARKHAKVLRLAPGARVELFDGEGHLAEAELRADGRAEILRTWTAPSPTPELTLVWGLPKAAAVDLGIRMATELGVDRIRPAIAERTPATPSPAKLERWRRIAREATRQCERPRTPTLEQPRPFAEAADAVADVKLAALARQTAPGEPPPSSVASIVIAIGPEGGFSEAERSLLIDRLDYRALDLGPHVLRAETAVAAALTLARRLAQR